MRIPTHEPKLTEHQFQDDRLVQVFHFAFELGIPISEQISGTNQIPGLRPPIWTPTAKSSKNVLRNHHRRLQRAAASVIHTSTPLPFTLRLLPADRHRHTTG
ncbi:hypothetical protein H6504_01395 [Candidatus Woesearchaeota archaeon]|nr:hypothetical protein [Candidatus Woesearchaeota archaeon]